jgi:hypothetical protein
MEQSIHEHNLVLMDPIVILHNAGPATLFIVSFVEKELQHSLPDGIMV